MGFLDRSVVLAGQAFSAILPLVMVLSSISPQSGGDSPTAILGRRLGLKPSDVASLQAAIAPPPSARASIGGLGGVDGRGVVVVATVVGAVLAEDPGRLGRFIRAPRR